MNSEANTHKEKAGRLGAAQLQAKNTRVHSHQQRQKEARKDPSLQTPRLQHFQSSQNGRMFLLF